MDLRSRHHRRRVRNFIFTLLMIFATYAVIYPYITTPGRESHSNTGVTIFVKTVKQTPSITTKYQKSSTSLNTTAKLSTAEDRTDPSAVSYIYSAHYSLETQSVTLFVERACNNQRIIRIAFDKQELMGGKSPSLMVPTNNGCPWSYAPMCDWGGFKIVFENIDQKIIAESAGMVHVWQENENNVAPNTVTMHVHTPAHLPASKPHKLAVCIQPVFLFDDWQAIVQFIELWKQNGATKFYVYQQSYSRSVDVILRAYAEKTKIDGVEESMVERMDWSVMPDLQDADGKSYSANEHVYRADMFTAINECLARAKPVADWVALVDLDEVIVRNQSGIWDENETFTGTLDRMLKENPDMGAIMVRSQLVLMADETNSETTKNTMNTIFSDLKSSSVSSYVFPTGRMSKLIVRPERVNLTHIHEVLEYKKINDGARTFGFFTKKPDRVYKTLKIEPNIMSVMHARRAVNRQAYKDAFAADRIENEHFTDLIEQAEHSWQQQQSRWLTQTRDKNNNNNDDIALDENTLQSQQLANLLNAAADSQKKIRTEILDILEQCVQHHLKRMKVECMAVPANCAKWLNDKMKRPLKWIYAQQRWKTLF